MKTRTKAEVGARLARLQGQVRGLAAMVEDDRDPVDVLTLLAAIRSALDGVGSVVLTQQVESVLAQAGRPEGLTEEELAARTERVRRALARFVS